MRRRSLNCNVELNEKPDGTGELTFTTQESGYATSKRSVTTAQLDERATKTLADKFTVMGVPPAN